MYLKIIQNYSGERLFALLPSIHPRKSSDPIISEKEKRVREGGNIILFAAVVFEGRKLNEIILSVYLFEIASLALMF